MAEVTLHKVRPPPALTVPPPGLARASGAAGRAAAAQRREQGGGRPGPPPSGSHSPEAGRNPKCPLASWSGSVARDETTATHCLALRPALPCVCGRLLGRCCHQTLDRPHCRGWPPGRPALHPLLGVPTGWAPTAEDSLPCLPCTSCAGGWLPAPRRPLLSCLLGQWG